MSQFISFLNGLDADEHVPVEPQQVYHFAAVRTDHRFRLFIDGRQVLVFTDQEPLQGEGHEHFAFNDWTAPVRFDNLRVYDLGD